MAIDNHPSVRQAKALKRRKETRQPYQRILIVCEGEKTEPLYLSEIRTQYRLASSNVQILPSSLGTEPLQIVGYAEQLFRSGDQAKGIYPKSFDLVYVVFDRDSHLTYPQALAKAAALNGKLRNDMGERVQFAAVVSVPCFELWLLLHFQNVQAPMTRGAVYQALKQHLPDYDKGQGGRWRLTQHLLPDATQRALACAQLTTAHNGVEPYTDMHQLVATLTQLRQ